MQDWDTGHGTKCASADRHHTHTHEGNRRGDWMKHWADVYKDTQALNTMDRKTPAKQTTYRSQKAAKSNSTTSLPEKKIEIQKDIEANDMIHMGSDLRCVMATFTIQYAEF